MDTSSGFGQSSPGFGQTNPGVGQPNRRLAAVMKSGSLTAAELTLTLSAPAFRSRRQSSTLRTTELRS